MSGPPRYAAFIFCALVAAEPAAAQVAVSDPPGPFVIDVRATAVGVPQDQAFYPVVPGGTIIPSRGFGFDIGAHVYLPRFGAARLGIGASVLRALAGSSPPPAQPSTPGATPTPQTIPDVDATLTILAPQLSLNFGSGDGWSYVSGGYGIAGFRIATAGIATTAVRQRGSLGAINAGAGARWFLDDHVAFSFDIRLHVVGAKEQPAPLTGTPRSMLMAASVGISLK